VELGEVARGNALARASLDILQRRADRGRRSRHLDEGLGARRRRTARPYGLTTSRHSSMPTQIYGTAACSSDTMRRRRCRVRHHASVGSHPTRSPIPGRRQPMRPGPPARVDRRSGGSARRVADLAPAGGDMPTVMPTASARNTSVRHATVL